MGFVSPLETGNLVKIYIETEKFSKINHASNHRAYDLDTVTENQIIYLKKEKAGKSTKFPLKVNIYSNRNPPFSL